MPPALSIIATIGIGTYVMAAVAFGYYVRVALRNGSAVGLGWSFERSQSPGLYRLQIGVALLFSVYFAMSALAAFEALERAANSF